MQYDPKNHSEEAENLQTYLNLLPGIYLKIDGLADPAASTAYRRITESLLPGDPRTNA